MIKLQVAITLLLILFFQGNSFAKELVEVRGIIIEVQVVGDISPNQAKRIAINKAKIEALRKAGIAESVSSQQLLFSSEVNNDFKEFFSSGFQIEIRGAVQSYEVTSEKLYARDGLGGIFYSITINAKVVKYDTSPDASFDANIDGIKAVYVENSNLKFSLRSTQDCHLIIFNIGDKATSLLFPSVFEPTFKIKALEAYEFPISEINYTMYIDSGKAETNRLVFLFTKKKYNYIKVKKDGLTSKEEMFEFIYSIPPDERKIEYLSYYITKAK